METKLVSGVDDIKEMLEENDYVVSKDIGGDIIYMYMNSTEAGVEEIKFTIDQARELISHFQQIIDY